MRLLRRKTRPRAPMCGFEYGRTVARCPSCRSGNDGALVQRYNQSTVPDATLPALTRLTVPHPHPHARSCPALSPPHKPSSSLDLPTMPEGLPLANEVDDTMGQSVRGERTLLRRAYQAGVGQSGRGERNPHQNVQASSATLEKLESSGRTRDNVMPSPSAEVGLTVTTIRAVRAPLRFQQTYGSPKPVPSAPWVHYQRRGLGQQQSQGCGQMATRCTKQSAPL